MTALQWIGALWCVWTLLALLGMWAICRSCSIAEDWRYVDDLTREYQEVDDGE